MIIIPKIKKINSQHVIFFGCILILIYLVLMPLGMLLIGSLLSAPVGEPGAHFTFKNYIEGYLRPRFLRLLGNSLTFGIGTCLLTFFLGVSFSWIYERTNTPLKKTIGLMALVPFIIPGVLSTVAWILLLSPKIGVINLMLMKLLGFEKPPFNIYSMSGMIWAQSIHAYPLVFLMMAASFRSMDMALEESSLMSGANTATTFYRITLPLMRPAFFSAMLIMFIQAIEAFAVPALIGMPRGIEVFTSDIYLAIHVYPSNYGLAAGLSATLLFFSAAGVFFYRKATKYEKRFATVTGKGFRPRLIDLGRFKYVVASLSVVFFVITAGFPIFILLWSSLIPYYEPPSWEALSKLSLKNYVFLFNYPTVMSAFKNSFFLMLATATLTMLLTSVIAWIVVKSKVKGRGFLDSLAFIPIALPGIVLGVSLLFVYVALPIPIYGTIWILVVAYITKYVPYGIRTTGSTIIQIHYELEEASALSGATWMTTFRRVTLPLLIPGFMAGWIYIAMVSLRELSTSILLYSPGTEVLSIVVFNLWEAGQYPALCALGLVMVGILIVLAYGANKVGARIGIKRAN